MTHGEDRGPGRLWQRLAFLVTQLCPPPSTRPRPPSSTPPSPPPSPPPPPPPFAPTPARRQPDATHRRPARCCRRGHRHRRHCRHPCLLRLGSCSGMPQQRYCSASQSLRPLQSSLASTCHRVTRRSVLALASRLPPPPLVPLFAAHPSVRTGKQRESPDAAADRRTLRGAQVHHLRKTRTWTPCARRRRRAGALFVYHPTVHVAQRGVSRGTN
mmetsp:Transcript_20424/g.64013  ORF Transcript_20424/g.64013 Transcript_20424/m.64013 type:complete len:214 (-) Transcript_20424:149-790(-)